MSDKRDPALRRQWVGKRKRGADATRPNYRGLVRTASGRESGKTEVRLCVTCGEAFFANPRTKVTECESCR